MNENEIKTASREAVHEVLSSLGFDTSNKITMQRQMASLREVASLMENHEFRSDLIHLRKWRIATERANLVGATTIIGLVLSGVLGALWLGFKMMVTK